MTDKTTGVTVTQALLPVTQSDRDAAASIAPLGSEIAGMRRDGRHDGLPVVQAFARHRTAHSGDLAPGLERAAQWHDARCKGPDVFEQELHEVSAKALRHLAANLDAPKKPRRSEERRVGKECVSTGRFGWSPEP